MAIEGRYQNSTAFTYGFTLSRVTDSEAELEIGELIRGRIEGPGDSIAYSFELTSDMRLFFDSLRNAGNLHWTLEGPHGVEVSSRYFNDSRSEEHTSELQSLMRISYAVFCLKKKNNIL